MNPLLESLITQFSVQAQELLDLLEAGRLTPRSWRDRMAMLLARYHSAAMMTGIGSVNLPVDGVDLLERTLASQYGFLQRFYTEVAAAEAFKASWRARVNMYGNATGSSYWDGYIYKVAGKMLPIPSTPQDGTTTCKSNCRCSLRVVPLDGNDFDVYWELGEADHCQICVERAEQWNPLRIRDGILVETAVKTWDSLTDEIIERHRDLWEKMANDDAATAVPT